ncbi:MAG: hypothetical protein M0Z59_05060 [Nitrospiraceae bacterium]|nr:hypothetical protein [Nitrospiraceae bacterium]
MKKKFLIRAALSVAAIAALVVFLKTLNWLPSAIEDGYMRSYADVSGLRLKSGIKDPHVPSYFPEGLRWPPSAILAQRRPYPAIIMEFNGTKRNDVCLEIFQYARGGRMPAEGRIKFSEIKEKARYALKGRPALLEAGVCGGEPCSRITWDEGTYRMRAVMKSPPFELIRVAGSMLR